MYVFSLPTMNLVEWNGMEPRSVALEGESLTLTEEQGLCTLGNVSRMEKQADHKHLIPLPKGGWGWGVAALSNQVLLPAHHPQVASRQNFYYRDQEDTTLMLSVHSHSPPLPWA